MQNAHFVSTIRNTPCVCAVVRRTSRAVTQFYDLVLSPSGLKTTQFIILREIAEAGEVAQWQLAERLAIATETLSRRLGLARRKGLLMVRRGAKRGERIYRLTAYGTECLQNALPHWYRAQERLGRALGDCSLTCAIDLLNRITLAAQAAEEIRAANSAANPRSQPIGKTGSETRIE